MLAHQCLVLVGCLACMLATGIGHPFAQQPNYLQPDAINFTHQQREPVRQETLETVNRQNVVTVQLPPIPEPPPFPQFPAYPTVNVVQPPPVAVQPLPASRPVVFNEQAPRNDSSSQAHANTITFTTVTAPTVHLAVTDKIATGVNVGDSGLDIHRAMLALTLAMSRCRNYQDVDCSDNSVFSPLSVSSSLSMLLMGTNGNSYTQLRSALGYHRDANDADIHVAHKQLMERVTQLDVESGSSVVLSVANGLFSQAESRFTNEFIGKAKDFYNSEVRELDILRNPYASVNSVNRWVSDRTHGRIANILSSLPPDTQMIVANAVYFNANWEDPFAVDLTRSERFFVSPAEILTVPTMLTHSQVAYAESPADQLDCKMIGIPYKGKHLGMFILLPRDDQGVVSLNRLEAKLSVDLLEQLFGRLESKIVSIQLPRFRIQQKLQLKNALRTMGVTDLFSPTAADLSRMMSKSGVSLDNIVHQTFIEVTESGTEAAAATVLNLSRDGPSKSFVANRPFLFLVRDMASKVIFFYGRLVRPSPPGPQ